MPPVYLSIQGAQTGPFTPERLWQMRAENLITASTPAWHEGLNEWSTVDAILASSPQPPPAIPIPIPSVPVGQRMMANRNPLNQVILISALLCGAGIVVVLCFLGFVFFSAGKSFAVAEGPIYKDPKWVGSFNVLMQTDTISHMMAAYAADHGGNYPDGKTSTEVFQKLLDGNYASDPNVFFCDLSGKKMPRTRTLTSDNVCFDVTGGITATSSGRIPVVFTTGFIVTYEPGAGVTRDPDANWSPDRIAVTYKNGVGATDPERFIESDFQTGNAKYVQLKP